MTVKIYWRNGDEAKWASTYMGFADGFLLEYEHLHCDDIETLGVRISRGYHSTDPDDPEAYMICREKVIVSPDELGNVLAISKDGAFKLLLDPETDRLADVQLPQLEALVLGRQPGAVVEGGSPCPVAVCDVLEPGPDEAGEAS